MNASDITRRIAEQADDLAKKLVERNAEISRLRAKNERLRKALDAAMQYVTPKDREWVESLAAAPEGATDAP